MEVYCIIAPALGSAGPYAAAVAGASIGLAAVAAACSGRLRRKSRRRRRGAGRLSTLRGLFAPSLLAGVLTLELTMLSLGGDPFARGAAIGAAVLGVTFTGFVTGVARLTPPRPTSFRTRSRAQGA